MGFAQVLMVPSRQIQPSVKVPSYVNSMALSTPFVAVTLSPTARVFVKPGSGVGVVAAAGTGALQAARTRVKLMAKNRGNNFFISFTSSF